MEKLKDITLTTTFNERLLFTNLRKKTMKIFLTLLLFLFPPLVSAHEYERGGGNDQPGKHIDIMVLPDVGLGDCLNFVIKTLEGKEIRSSFQPVVKRITDVEEMTVTHKVRWVSCEGVE